MAARKAISASRQGAQLKRRALGLREELKENNNSLDDPTVGNLVESLDREFRLWNRKAISDSEFSKQIDETVERYRKLSEKRSLEQNQQQASTSASLEGKPVHPVYSIDEV
ncbi:MAG: hypothetical protein KA368_19490 [Acidobacteria bacterium]|nr:hypothetical protein [Acidobacteriota bacterium]